MRISHHQLKVETLNYIWIWVFPAGIQNSLTGAQEKLKSLGFSAQNHHSLAVDTA